MEYEKKKLSISYNKFELLIYELSFYRENDPKSLATIPYNFETIRCMNEMASEFKPTIREGIRYWNMTVQYWLAMYIYRKTAASKTVK